MQKKNYTGKQGRTGLIIVVVAATIVLIPGIKYYIGPDNNSASHQPAAEPQQLFKNTSGGGTAPGYNPAARSETSSGGGLAMFAKTNLGYSRGGMSPEAEKPGARKSTAAARKKAGKKEAEGTVIPRLQPAKSFGIQASAGVYAPSPGKGRAGILQQAQLQYREKMKKKDTGR